MPQAELAALSITELHARLRKQAGQVAARNKVDLDEAFAYLTALPASAHTRESTEALLYLARNFQLAGDPSKCLETSRQAAPLAFALDDKLLQYAARALEGAALGEVGKFSEAFQCFAEAWSLARAIPDVERQVWTLGNVGVLCGGIGQPHVAAVYFERARQLAEKHGLDDLEFHSRGNLADCFLQLRDPVAGIRVLSQLKKEPPRTKLDFFLLANIHHTLARLYLMLGDLESAKNHVSNCVRLAKTARVKRTTQHAEAVQGLVSIWSGKVDKGLAMVHRAMKSAESGDQTDYPDWLGICIDAYEAAGLPEEALAYLQELSDWRKKTVEMAVLPPNLKPWAEAPKSQPSVGSFDDGFAGRAHSLWAQLQAHSQSLIETAINAEIASGYDLYRTFRIAKLSRCLATAIGWSENRIASLVLGAKLINIGMIAIPSRVLLKPIGLTRGEMALMRTHPQYGAELLVRSNLKGVRHSTDCR